MTILGIETSCDETGAAIVRDDPRSSSLKIEKNVLSTSIDLHAKTGGIIPENAAREQLKLIIPVIKEAIKGIDPKKDVDSIAVTYGPGLIGSLLVGVETARTLSYIWNKPLIPVNHLYGHIYANFIQESEKRKEKSEKLNKKIEFPAVALVVSGGHTDLLVMKSHTDIKVLGATRDDAAGEAFDKIGRLLDLPYPAGPVISKLAEKGDPNSYKFPRPMIGSKDFDFSFSGLKTSVLNQKKIMKRLDEEAIKNICASSEQAIVDVLVRKTVKASKEYRVKSVLLGGGVASNTKLRESLEISLSKDLPAAKLFVPSKGLCTDNAAMIAAAAFYRNNPVAWQKIKADPSAYY